MFFKVVFFVAVIFFSINSYAKESYTANINIDIQNSEITGSITIEPDSNTIITLHTENFTNIYIDNSPLKIKTDKIGIELKKNVKKTIKYKKTFQDNDIAQDDFISVFSVVPPIENSNIKKYNINFSLPKKYSVITSGEEVTITDDGNNNLYNFTMFSQIETFDIIASSNYITYKEKYNDIEVVGYFFKENENLAKNYIEATIDYIEKYEKLLDSKFPYKRFSVVEHINSYGFAVPTYTVLGSKVIALPFIISTSLGHEVLHQWFGTGIDKKGDSNWLEGITTFFTDLGNLQTEDEKVAYRKNILVTYFNYMANEFNYPLKDFKYNDSKKSQSVGYGKGAMVFQMLYSNLGEEKFYKGIRKFVKNYMYKKASWNDIFSSFDGVNLKDFADFYINNPLDTEIFVKDSYFSVKNAENHITFNVEVKNAPKNFTIPYTLIYNDGEEKGKISLINGNQDVSIKVKNKDVKLVLDKDYEVMRHLTPDEKPAAISAFFYSKNLVAINDDKNSCKNFLDGFKDITTKHYKEATLIDFANNNVVICNFENPIIKTFTSDVKIDNRADSQYKAIKNPFSENNYILLVNKPLDENLPLLRHYGKYSYLQFKGKKNIAKVMDNADMGIEVFEGQKDTAIEPSALKSVEEIIKVASLYPVIFVGENHDNYAHHLNQLEVIKELHKQNKKIAVGFEMIQKQYQSVLDNYINGKISEYEFLKGVKYYEKWGFDYNLYAPIFRYLRQYKIPAIALNIDNNITRKIAEGKASSLTKEEVSQLPKSMNIPNKFYEKALRKIFNIHSQQNSKRTFTNFFLVQNIWDEVMAESIIEFQKSYGNFQVVAIVGQGHLNKKTGIPLRYERITGRNAFVITQDSKVDENYSDTVIFTKPVYSDGTPKIGVSVKNEDNKLIVENVSKNSPAEKAKILKGDYFVSCDKYKISDIGDLKYALFNKGYNAKINCTLKRKNKNINVVIDIVKYEEDYSSFHKHMMNK